MPEEGIAIDLFSSGSTFLNFFNSFAFFPETKNIVFHLVSFLTEKNITFHCSEQESLIYLTKWVKYDISNIRPHVK